MGWFQPAAEERLRFMEEYRSGIWSMAEVCRRFGISRITGYKWVARYREGGAEALRDRSRAPHRHPHQVLEEIEEAVLAARGEHPHWGPLKLRAWLETQAPEIAWPAPSTIGEILRRNGLSVTRWRRHSSMPPPEMAKSSGPNAVWHAALSDWLPCRDGSRCMALLITDRLSGFLLRCQALRCPDTAHLGRLFEAAFREHGLPARLRTEKQAPFAGSGITGLSPLHIWWLRLGIQVELGRTCNARLHRRLLRVLESEPQSNRRQTQKVLDAFRHDYNFARPRPALAGKTPAELYRRTGRTYSGRIPPFGYPPGFTTRRVHAGGRIRWNNREIFVDPAFAGEIVALEPARRGGWRVWFCGNHLADLDAAGRIHARRAPFRSHPV